MQGVRLSGLLSLSSCVWVFTFLWIFSQTRCEVVVYGTFVGNPREAVFSHVRSIEVWPGALAQTDCRRRVPKKEVVDSVSDTRFPVSRHMVTEPSGIFSIFHDSGPASLFRVPEGERVIPRDLAHPPGRD